MRSISPCRRSAACVGWGGFCCARDTRWRACLADGMMRRTEEVTMRQHIVMTAALLLAVPAAAQNPFDAVKSAAGQVKTAAGPGVTKEVEKQVNAKLTSEARKNQCSFKSD